MYSYSLIMGKVSSQNVKINYEVMTGFFRLGTRLHYYLIIITSLLLMVQAQMGSITT